MNTLAHRIKELLPQGFATMSTIDAVSASNAFIYDSEGRRYIDFASSSSAMNLGHRHPEVVEAMQDQLDKFVHTFFQQVPYSSYLDLVEVLHRITPGEFRKKTVLNSTGCEAVETAVRIAKAHTKRQTVLCFTGSFHGRSLLGSALSNNAGTALHDLNNIVCAPFVSMDDEPFDAIAYAKQLANLVPLDKIAAIIIEPVQGESGFNVVQKPFLDWLRCLATNNGTVLIVDEVQSGLARTGTMFALDQYYVEPDIILVSKTLGGGLPLSAVVGRAEIMDAPTTFGGTFSGTPLAVAAALRVIEVIETQQVCRTSQTLGVLCMSRLQDFAKYPFVKKMRGLGSMLSLEIDVENYPQLTTTIQRRARDNGLLLLSAGINKSRIRFLYPLTIEKSVLDEGLTILDNVFKELANELR